MASAVMVMGPRSRGLELGREADPARFRVGLAATPGYAARSVTVLLRIRQLASGLSFAAVTLMRAGWVSAGKAWPTFVFSSAPLPAALVIVATMPPSTTSGVIDRRTLKVAVPASTS